MISISKILSIYSIAFLSCISWSFAAETDNYTLPPDYIKLYPDVTEPFNDHINEIIGSAITRWKFADRKNQSLAKKIAKKIDGTLLYGKNEWWARKKKDFYPYEPKHTIYRDAIVFDGIFLATVGVVENIIVNGIPVGLDKISHFFDGGLLYYSLWTNHGDESKVLKFGNSSESGLFGQWTTGVFSNGDLVANYEGFRFVRSLVEDNIIPGKSAIIGFDTQGNPFMQRKFDFRDHVNAYWNEAMNPSDFKGPLVDKVLNRLIDLCPNFQDAPELYTLSSTTDGELWNQYEKLGLRDRRSQRLDTICAQF